MRHVKELLEETTRIGEVTIRDDDHDTHLGLHEMARQSGVQLRRPTELTLGSITLATDIEAEATRHVAGIAQWIKDEGTVLVLAPMHRAHRLGQLAAERAITLAAMRVVNEENQTISVLVPRGPGATQGSWSVDAPFDGADQSATSYTRHLIRPGILAVGSVEHHFAGPASE